MIALFCFATFLWDSDTCFIQSTFAHSFIILAEEQQALFTCFPSYLIIFFLLEHYHTFYSLIVHSHVPFLFLHYPTYPRRLALAR